MLIKLPVSMFSKVMANGDKKFFKTHKTFGNFSVKKDLAYIEDGDPMHMLDIICPILNHDNGIVLFYIHGGGYVYGTKESTRIFTSWFASQGFTVVSINYRLITKKGDVDVFDQTRDVIAALNYVYDNCHNLGLKLDKFCIMGDSAGGHLSLMTDIIFKSKEVQDFYKIEKLPPINIKCLALNSTMYDYESLFPLARKFLSKNGVKGIFSKHCYEDGYFINNSPKTYINKGIKLDPIFNSTSYNDFFLDQSNKLKKDAAKFNLDYEHYYDNSIKKEVGHVFNHFMFEEEGLKCNLAMCDFFKKHCNIE